jgi:hypothetical protein
MSDSNLPAVVQPDLLTPDLMPAGHELLTIDEDERRGRFTGERIAKNRQLYQAIVKCLAEGIGIRHTARAFRVSPNTLMAIRQREGIAIETEKKELSAKMGLFVKMSVERLIEEIDCIPIGQLSVSAGIIADKKALIDGDPTVRIEEKREIAVTPSDLRQMLENMKRAQPVIDVEAATEPQKERPSDVESDGSTTT